MNMEPVISIIMPVFNAEGTIEETLRAIRDQNYPQDNIEILVIDGGSTDRTVEIAKKYNAILFKNQRKLPEAAKEIGFCKCSGKYALYIDADEVFINPDSLRKRVEILEKHPNLKSITATGKISKKTANAVTVYSNYVSDPFSYFVYQLNGNNRMEELNKKYKHHDFGEYVIYSYKDTQVLPLFDAAMNMFDMEFARKKYMNCKNKSNFTANIFENLVRGSGMSAMLKDDMIYHIPEETIKTYLLKMKWRVYNNVFKPQNEGIGFTARSVGSQKLNKRKVLYVVYSCMVIPPLAESFYLAFSKRNLCYLLHFWVNEYVMFWIGAYMLMKFVGITPTRSKGYGK